MKTIRLFLTALLLFYTSVFQNLKAENYALVIAIGDYPDDKGWIDISSSNDIPHVVGALNRLGFSKSNITIIKDSQATRKNILTKFDELSKKLKKGDQVFIHYSGHGQQVLDDNNDELDLLDESIVPYDSPLEYIEGENEGQFLIRDDELGRIMLSIRKKLGSDGQVFLVMDSCHSGTGTRSLSKARGSAHIMAPQNFKLLKIKENNMAISPEKNKDLAKCISFFGSSAKELNFETLDEQQKPVGSLSYALSSVLASLTESTTYEDIFYQVRLKMKKLAPMQNPQWEGPRNTTLFGTQKTFTNNSFQINKIIDSQNIEVLAGTLTGIHQGTLVEIIEGNTVLAEGLVIKSNLSNSFIKLNELTDLDKNKPYKVEVKEFAHPSIYLNLSSEIQNNSPWNTINDEILNLNYIQTCETNADIILRESSKGALLLNAKNGEEFLSLKSPTANSMQEVQGVFKSFLQAQFLRSFSNTNPILNCSISLVQVDPVSEKEIKTINTDGDIKVGSSLKFRIKNEGINGAYVSLLDIQPDNYINLIIPPVHLGYKAEEYYIKPGDSLTTNFVVEIGEPLGEETLLLLASKKPLELADIIQNKGYQKRAIEQLSIFEQQFSHSYGTAQKRGITSKRKQKEKLSSKTLFFNIVPN